MRVWPTCTLTGIASPGGGSSVGGAASAGPPARKAQRARAHGRRGAEGRLGSGAGESRTGAPLPPCPSAPLRRGASTIRMGLTLMVLNGAAELKPVFDRGAVLTGGGDADPDAVAVLDAPRRVHRF